MVVAYRPNCDYNCTEAVSKSQGIVALGFYTGQLDGRHSLLANDSAQLIQLSPLHPVLLSIP